MKSVGVILLTLNAEKHLSHCLKPLIDSSLKPKILIVDSQSSDQTLQIAKTHEIEVLTVNRSDFNHGMTREFARRQLKTDIVVFVTVDAYAVDSSSLEKLILPLVNGTASLAYGRQLPHQGADFFEAFPREFNYPNKSEIRCIADIPSKGPLTYFFSDSFSAYLNSALDEIGGFKKVVLGEDTLAAAELIKKGHKLAYVAEAKVRHSHGYSLKQEFCRYFDTGLMRKQYENVLNCAVGDQKRAHEYVRKMLKDLYNQNPKLLPYACLHVLAKWLGYRLGQKSFRRSNWIKKLFSSQKYFWEKNASS